MRDLTDELAEALRKIEKLTSPKRYEATDPETVAEIWSIATLALARPRWDEAQARREGTTHDATCYELGPRHYECALAEIERLRGWLDDGVVRLEATAGDGRCVDCGHPQRDHGWDGCESIDCDCPHHALGDPELFVTGPVPGDDNG